MKREEYNYAEFVMAREMPVIEAFGDLSLRPGMSAPSHPLEDLVTGERIEMQELWRDGLVIVEFGSFT